MGNAQSHTYAEPQRDNWIRNGPQHISGSDALRRTRSPTDEFMPEYGYTPCPREGHMPRAASTLSGPFVASFDNVHELMGRHPPKVSDARRIEEPTPACTGLTPAQAKALRSQSEGHIQVGHSLPSPPARNASDGHVHFENNLMQGIRDHDHAYARPRTPYPNLGNRS